MESWCEDCRAADAGPARASPPRLGEDYYGSKHHRSSAASPCSLAAWNPPARSGGDRRPGPGSPRAAGLASRVYCPSRGCADALPPPSTSPLAVFWPLNETRPTGQSKLAGSSAGGGRRWGPAGPCRAVPAAPTPPRPFPRGAAQGRRSLLSQPSPGGQWIAAAGAVADVAPRFPWRRGPVSSAPATCPSPPPPAPQTLWRAARRSLCECVRQRLPRGPRV